MLRLNADEAGLAAATKTLLSGGVVVIPTDTVYGLAAPPDFPAAVARLYPIKQREAAKPIALLAADAAAAERFLGGMDPVAQRVAERRWPGALTLVLAGTAPRARTHRGTEAVTVPRCVLARGDTTPTFEGLRVPDHDWTRRLLAACGGVLRVTSANLSGQRAATEAEDALKDVGLSADLVIDDGISPGGVASTVAKIVDGRITVLREGPVKFLTLASGSPRRAKILSQLGIDFTVVKTDAPEVAYADDPERTVRENALAKGAVPRPSVPRCVLARGAGTQERLGDAAGEDALRYGILSADTIVWHKGKIYGKPRDLDEAKQFLRELSGETHTVFTGVAYNGAAKVEKSFVTFKSLTDAEIDAYVARVKPTDRAGAYDIDEAGDWLIERYEGEYENIMGLPVGPLKEWGLCN